MVLHYYSQRVGLWTWVEGIVDEVAKQIFGIQVRMERLRGRDTGDCDHEVGVGGKGMLPWGIRGEGARSR